MECRLLDRARAATPPLPAMAPCDQDSATSSAPKPTSNDWDSMMASMQAVKEEIKKGNKLLASMVDGWNSTAPAEKRNINPLPLVDSKTTFEMWNSQLRAALTPHNLLPYLYGGICEPPNKNSTEWATWNIDRRDVFQLITASVTDPNVWFSMTRIGWNPENSDPAEAYTKVLEVLQVRSENMTLLRTLESFSLRPESFDTLDAYLTRVCVLRQQLRRAGLENHVKTEIYTVLSVMQRSYPRVVDGIMLMLEGIAAEGGTVEWAVFIKDLTLECAQLNLEQSLARTRLE